MHYVWPFLSPHSLNTTTEALEAKCDELTKQIADITRQKNTLQRQNDKLIADRSTDSPQARAKPASSNVESNSFTGVANSPANNSAGPESMAYEFRTSSNSFASSSMYGDDTTSDEELSNVVNELNATRRQCKEEQQRVNDLEEQLNALSEWLNIILCNNIVNNSKCGLVQENQELASRIQSAVVAEEMKSMQDELSILDEARLVLCHNNSIKHSLNI